jgi:hypothetical protein
MNRLFTTGGIVASAVLIVFGIASIVIGAAGRADVRDRLEQEQITGTPDMTPELTEAAVAEANLTDVEIPDCEVANKRIDSGDRAQCFADYLRIHALEDTGGKVYAEMPRFATADGEGTNDPAEALKDPETGEPMSNQARNIWVTATALSTALNTSFFAESVALFSIVMGIALLLTGIGFLVLTLGALRNRPENLPAR